MIEETIDLVLSRLPRSSGDNLAGFLMDCDHFFSQPEEIFREADAKATGDPRSMIAVTVTLAAVKWHREAMVLRFVTASPESGLLVTGTVVASGGGYQRVVAEFEGKFRALPSWRR